MPDKLHSGNLVTPQPRVQPAASRLAVLDVLRGVALLGILVVNLPFLAHPIYDQGASDYLATPLDSTAAWLVAFAFQAKFYVLFSFLFGYGLSLQLNSAQARGGALGPRYARRLFGLAVFGVLHAVFFFIGDILVSYALLGIALWFVRAWSPRALLRLAAVMMVLAVLARILLALGGELSPAAQLELTGLASEARIHYLGSFWDGVEQRLRDLVVFYIFTPLFNWPTAMAMFALGLAAGKVGVFAEVERYWPPAKRSLPWALLLGVGGNALFATAGGFRGGLSVSPVGAVALGTLEALSAPALSFVYVMGALWLARRPGRTRVLAPVQAAGRMSLTNYIGQAVIASYLFNGWGLGLYGQVGAFGCLLLTFAIFTLQLFGSSWWLRYFRQGPDEWLLRSWTYLKWQPWRARKAAGTETVKEVRS